jgi:hypothetical protein
MLVEASDLFTPADIEFAARKGSQRALGLAIYGELDTQPRVGGPTTDGYLAALSETRPTLTKVIVEEFTEDIATIARLQPQPQRTAWCARLVAGADRVATPRLGKGDDGAAGFGAVSFLRYTVVG